MKSFKDDEEIPLLVMDGHRSHLDLIGVCDGIVEKFYTPPMSCILNNPIETFWSAMKKRYTGKVSLTCIVIGQKKTSTRKFVHQF